LALRSPEAGEQHPRCQESGEERNGIICRDTFGACFARHASRFMIHFTTSRRAMLWPHHLRRIGETFCYEETKRDLVLHLRRLYESGERDQSRLTVLGLSFLRDRDIEIKRRRI
jgi:hypothetical protein